MKTAIVYASVHHGNTKKIIDEIAKTNDVELIDATQTVEKDLSEYDLIGFASGVYGGKFHQSVLKFASVNLTDNKNIFLICTYGGRPVFKSIEQVIAYKHDNIVGRFSCKGFDTFGPFILLNTQIMLRDFIGRVIVDIHQQSRWCAVLPGVISKCLSQRVTADMFILNCLLGSSPYNPVCLNSG